MTDYRSAGVDLAAADRIVDAIRKDVTDTWRSDVVGSFGGFAAGIEVPAGYRSPVLMLSTDGVGTKAELARQTGLLDGLGFDLVAMCVDDLAAAGARPLAMTDYLAIGSNDEETVARLVASVGRACVAAECTLLGGETAIHPGVLDADQFDLAGTALGIVERDRVIDGSAIRAGDAIVGLRSPNVRSNGFSLIRRAVVPNIDLDQPLPETERSAAEVLLDPSPAYAPVVRRIVDGTVVHGLAHITGGGIASNLSRILPPGLGAAVDTTSWERPPVFDAVATVGGVEPDEMWDVFNMGIGFVVVTPEPDAASAIVDDSDATPFVIGRITSEAGVALR